MGDEGCTVYAHRPWACRGYDCRVPTLYGLRDSVDGVHNAPAWAFRTDTPFEKQMNLAYFAAGEIVGKQLEPGARTKAAILTRAPPLVPEIYNAIRAYDGQLDHPLLERWMTNEDDARQWYWGARVIPGESVGDRFVVAQGIENLARRMHREVLGDDEPRENIKVATIGPPDGQATLEQCEEALLAVREKHGVSEMRSALEFARIKTMAEDQFCFLRDQTRLGTRAIPLHKHLQLQERVGETLRESILVRASRQGRRIDSDDERRALGNLNSLMEIRARFARLQERAASAKGEADELARRTQ